MKASSSSSGVGPASGGPSGELARAKLEDAMIKCKQILQSLLTHKDADPFLQPVKWEEWGLRDYPKVIKNPMDLGTVNDKLTRGEYRHPKEFKHDVNLVWHNCMTYNVEGSDYFNQAAKLKAIFEERYAKLIREDEDAANAASVRRPSLMDKKMFSQNLYNISSEDLGRVVHLLDEKCESCIKKVDPEDIEIEIDAIDDNTFWTVDAFVKAALPGGRKTAAGAGGAGAASMAAAMAMAPAGPTQPKKARKE